MFRLSVVDARFYFGLLIFTPKTIIYGFQYPKMIQDSPSGYWLSPRKKLCMGLWSSEFVQYSSSGYWFSSRSKFHMGLPLSEFYARFFFGILVFTPKQSTVIYGNDHTLVSWNFIWPSVLIGLRLLVYLTRVHRSVYPSSSSKEGSHRRIASECHLEK